MSSADGHHATRWHDVPPEYCIAWSETFNASQEGLNLAAQCPVCGIRVLHRWFYAWKPDERTIQGHRFVASGSQWQWCSHCRSFEHSSGLVPAWWSCDLVVDVTKLTAYPDAIEEARLMYQTPPFK